MTNKNDYKRDLCIFLVMDFKTIKGQNNFHQQNRDKLFSLANS